MILKLMRAAALTLCLALVACDANKPSAVDPKPKAESPRDIVFAIDGASFQRRDGTVERIAGIDAPKLAPAAGCWAEAALAIRSQATLDNYLKAGVTTQEVGRNAAGQMVINAQAGEKDLGDLMVHQGVAAKSVGDGAWDWCGGKPDVDNPAGPDLKAWISNPAYRQMLLDSDALGFGGDGDR